MKSWICTFAVVVALVSGVSMASTSETVQADVLAQGKASLELGIVAGSTLQGLELGVWNLLSTPLFLRGSAGVVFGPNLGAAAELGYAFDREGDFKQFAAAVGGVMITPNFLSSWLGGPSYLNSPHIGAQYGVILWKVFTISAGASYFGNINEGFLMKGLLPTGKIGVNFFF